MLGDCRKPVKLSENECFNLWHEFRRNRGHREEVDMNFLRFLGECYS